MATVPVGDGACARDYPVPGDGNAPSRTPSCSHAAPRGDKGCRMTRVTTMNTVRFQRFACLIALASAAPARAEGPPARTVLVGGKVFTADPDRPWATAVAIEGDRVIAVGSDDDVLRHR